LNSPPHVCSTPELECSTSYVVFHLFVFSESRWKVNVRFVNIGGIAVHDFLIFLFISIYKYNANTYKNYIYSIKYWQITYIQNNSLIYLNFETYPYSRLFFIIWSLCSGMCYQVNIFYDNDYQL
jgi:hypothetical protein